MHVKALLSTALVVGLFGNALVAPVSGAAADTQATAAPRAPQPPPRTLQLRVELRETVTLRVTGPQRYERLVPVTGRKTLRNLRPGTYKVRAAAVAVAGLTFTPTKRVKTVRVTAKRGARASWTFRTSGQDSVTPPPTPTDVVAPTSEPPAGAIADVLARINAARAAGFRCDGTSGPALPPIGYSAELGELARWHADDFAAGRTNDFVADLNRSGYGGAFVGQSAVLCPKIADAAGVFTAMSGWESSCVHLFDAQVDRIGIGYAHSDNSQNIWVLTFGRSSSR